MACGMEWSRQANRENSRTRDDDGDADRGGRMGQWIKGDAKNPKQTERTEQKKCGIIKGILLNQPIVPCMRACGLHRITLE